MASTADFWSGWSPITLPFRCCLLFSAIFAFKFTSRIFYIVHASVKCFTLVSRVVTFSCPKLVFFTKSQNIDDWTLEFSKEIVVSLLLTVWPQNSHVLTVATGGSQVTGRGLSWTRRLNSPPLRNFPAPPSLGVTFHSFRSRPRTMNGLKGNTWVSYCVGSAYR
jgi:hypothetical protein